MEAYKKITPKGGLSWYVKWIASIIILVAVVFRSIGYHEYDLWLSLFGIMGWFWVGLLWHDRSLIVLNGILAFVLIIGIAKFYTGA